YGVAAGALLISGRRVDPDRARLPVDGLRFLPIDFDCTVRHIVRFPERSRIALNLQQTGRSARPQLDARVDRVRHGDAIHREGVDVDARLEWAERNAPDALLVLGQFRRLVRAQPVTG